MRILNREPLSTILVLSMFVIVMTFVPEVILLTPSSTNQAIKDTHTPGVPESLTPIQNKGSVKQVIDHSTLSYDVPAEGILNPVVVQQSGYAASEIVSARTDTRENLDYDLPLDVAHNWVADEAEVAVWNLEKLYAINGTFSAGIPGINVKPNNTAEYYPFGWSANSTDTATFDGDLQLATYDDTGRQFISVESAGGKVGQQGYGHDTGVRVVWTQTIVNSPYTENFLLSFDYFYLRGPLDKNPSYPISGNCSVVVLVNGVRIWDVSLLTLSQRGVWTNTGVVPIEIPAAPASFLFEIGLEIDEYMYLDVRWDYDNNGIADGVGNAAYITVYFDDVSFIKETPPTAEQVDLQFATSGLSTMITGSMGTYYASIPNASYWSSTPVSVSLTSNTSVSFDYKTRLYSHRFTYSNWRTDISSLGVAYSIDHGSSSHLTLYAYVGYLGGYEEPIMMIAFPTDWENATVSDPFLTDLTGNCTIGNGFLSVPTSIIDRLGWWEIELESPNYAKSIKSQISDVTWRDETIFRISNMTRADITIGTVTQVLGSLVDVNVTWFEPSNIVWFSELIGGGSSGQITSTTQTFTSGSSPAGEWWVEVYWTNGTEIAYDRARLEVYHPAELIADPYVIDTDAGLTITGIVRYTDSDTGEYLMDPSATITANWSAFSVNFVPNTIHNWWEGSFDTSLVGAGVFTVYVNATRLYYDDASCEILVRSVQVTRLSSPNAPWTAETWGNIVTLTFRYELYDHSTMEWLPVNSTGVSASVNWTDGYWSEEATAEPGIFAVYLDSSIKNSSTYLLNTTFSKPHHQAQTLFLTLIISRVTSSLHIIGEISARVDLDEEHPLKLEYLDGSGSPIVYANVIVDSVTPSTGLIHSDVVEVIGESGNYSLSLTPHAAGVFTIRFMATAQNAEPAIAVFVLVVNDIDTVLEIAGPASIEIGLTDVYKTIFRYETLNGTGIEKADIEIYLSSGTKGTLDWEWSEIESGNYSVEFSSSSSGTYLITIAAFKQYYQSASSSIFLVVREITTQLTSLNGTAEIIGFGKSYQLYVSYTNGTGYGLSGASVTVENIVPATGLWWGNISEVSNGIYSISLKPEVSNTFTVLVQASLFNHQTRFILFTLTASEIPTSLNILTPGTTISLDQTFAAYLRFHDEDYNNLEDATLTIQNSPAGVSFSEFDGLGNGTYRVTITPLEIGTFDIIFKASKSGYQNGYASLALGAVRIPTNVYIASGLSSDSITFSESYELFVTYERMDTEANVTGATIDLLASPNTGISWSYIEVDDGYLITVETARTGRWTLSITMQKQAHVSSTAEFILDVNPIPIAVELLSETSFVEGTAHELLVKLTHQGTSLPVTNATVTYRISVAKSGDFLEMRETSTPGVYSAQFSMPAYSDITEYKLEVKIEKDNYLYVQGIYEQSIVKTIDFPTRMAPIITGGSGALAALLIVLGALRISSKRKKVQLDRDLINKRRFDDADNIIGVIILHKKSGIPIYSKMMKGGFEEGIVAAFITAVTHFREEFEMFSEDAMNVVPISDIIRAVQTRNLICAFITVKSASIEHNRKMEAYARQVGTYLDDLLDDMPSEVIDSKIEDMLDFIFNATMDGFLLKFYKVATSEKFPKRYELIDEILHDTDARHCTKPVLLAKSMTGYGVSEARGCTLVLEIIEKELIVICEGDETEDPEIDFADFFSKPDRADSSEVEE